MNIIYDIFDRMCADVVKVPVDDYIERIESLDEDAGQSIINRLLSDDDNEVQEGIKMYGDI